MALLVVLTVMGFDMPDKVTALLVTQILGVISTEVFNSKGSGEGLLAPWQPIKTHRIVAYKPRARNC